VKEAYRSHADVQNVVQCLVSLPLQEIVAVFDDEVHVLVSTSLSVLYTLHSIN